MKSWVSHGESASPSIAGLAGVRFAYSSETPEERRLNESLIKDLTGGDTLTGRFLFSNPFTFIPSHKLWLFGNVKPKVSGTDEGFWRRIRVIPFRVTIPDEVRRNMSAVLAEFQAEMPGILAWAVLVCMLWQTNGLEMPPIVDQATREYRGEQDITAQFIDQCCEMRPDFSVDKNALYRAWRAWCEENREEGSKNRRKRWLTQ